MTKLLTYVELDVPEFADGEDAVDPTLIYDFTENSLFGWTGQEATATATANGATLASTGDDPAFRSPAGLAIDGSANRYLRLDVERTALRTAGAWQGSVFYTHGGHGESASFTTTFPELENVVGAREVYLIDMGDLDAGGGDWLTNTITQFRFDFDDNQVGASTGASYLIRSVQVGSLDTGRTARLDGGTYMDRGAGLSNAADSKLLTCSLWVRPLAGIVDFDTILASATTVGGATHRTRLEYTGGAYFVGTNAAGTTILEFESADLTANEWSHVMFSVDLSDTAKFHVYVDGVSALGTLTTYTDDTMDFTLADWAVGAHVDGSQKIEADLADLWFAPGVYLDLSLETNRRRFISDFDSPVDMGATGELPTGASPLVYMSGPTDGWHVNKGSGGGFGIVGSPASLVDPGQVPETFRFAVPTSYLPREIPAIPSIESVSFTPATISLGQDLGVRASLNISFKDHRHRFDGEPFDQGTFWGKWRGRYATKLRGSAVRLIRGQVGQALSSMDTRHYVVDSTDGPSFDAVYTVSAKDLLKLADDDRAQAPTLSNGSLAGSIDDVTTTATLSPTGIGNLEYPSSGWVCLGGKEVVSFTRSSDTLTIVRAQFGSVASDHDAGDRVQLVLRYTGDDVADIIYDLFVNYAGMSATTIDLAEWRAETAAYLNVIYASTITEPTSVKKLVSELIEQAALAVWWDDRAKMVRLQVLREISTDSDTFDQERIITGSFSVKEQPNKRISQIWTYYGQRDPTDSGANEDNYRAALATVDLELEGEYGSAEIKKIQARWVETLTAANRLNSIQISRFRDPPRAFAWDLFRDQTVLLAGGYQLRWWGNQDEEGNEVPALVQVVRVTIHPDRIHVEAEEMLASGTVVLVNVVFLTTTGSLLQFPVPATWNSLDNSIEVIGAGAGGAWTSSPGGKGGGGGGYSAVTNLVLTPGALVSYRVGTPGVGGTPSSNNGTNGTDTWFNGATLAASSVGAKAGTGGQGRTGAGAGGQASAGVGSTKFSGGDGGNGAPEGETRAGGGGGGGAAGPHGDGGDGGDLSGTGQDAGSGGGAADGGSDGSSNSPGDGGNNRFNFGGGTLASVNGEEGGGGRGGDNDHAGGIGGDGEQLWTQTVAPITSAGPGGGGGGAGTNADGGDGGLYGGGGGGTDDDPNAEGGDGAQGIVVITWREA